MRRVGDQEEWEKLWWYTFVGGVGGVGSRQEAATQPDDVYQRPAVGAGEGVRADPLPRRLR